jgi:hypothetical protein
MNIENPVSVFAAGIIVIALLIWYTHRRLDKIQNELDALHQAFDLVSSRLLMIISTRKPEETAASDPAGEL